MIRLLQQGLAAIEHPGIVYRPGPSGWRAGLAGGPDVDEVVRTVRSIGASGDRAVSGAADSLGIDPRLVRIAIDYAAEHLEEIEERLRENDVAVDRCSKAGRGAHVRGDWMRFLLDEMYGERAAEILCERGHDAVHVRAIGLGGAPDVDVLARAVDERRTLVTENARDFLPLLDQRQSAGVSTTPVLVARPWSRRGGTLHARLADDIDSWAADNTAPYAHAHWLP